MRGLVARFIDLQIKALEGKALSDEDRLFLDRIECAAAMVPGILEAEVVRYGMGITEVEEASTADVSVRHQRPRRSIFTGSVAWGRAVAASSLPRESTLYAGVREAMQKGQPFYQYACEQILLDILEIDAEAGTVQPQFLEGYLFIIARRSAEPEQVGRFGGIHIAVEDLRQMTVVYDAQSKTLRIVENDTT